MIGGTRESRKGRIGRVKNGFALKGIIAPKTEEVALKM